MRGAPNLRNTGKNWIDKKQCHNDITLYMEQTKSNPILIYKLQQLQMVCENGF